ncbi:MAG TPA: hypothetical protein VMB77_13935 [Syntrophales bacterium]|nr:hypothetical protein [Syntrophales bacterium]
MATQANELSLQNLHLQSIVSRLNDDERIFRLALQTCILSAGGPVTVGDVIPFVESQMNRDKAQETLQSLIHKQIVVEGQGGVAFAFPVSAWRPITRSASRTKESIGPVAGSLRGLFIRVDLQGRLFEAGALSRERHHPRCRMSAFH